MRITKISYVEFEKSKRYWEFKDFSLSDISLVVGGNASGKTRILNVIKSLASLFLGERVTLISGKYNVDFNYKNKKYNYCVSFIDGIVDSEHLSINGDEMLHRKKSGKGQIYNVRIKQKIDIKVPTNTLVVCRRDEIQFPYLEHLYDWALHTVHFRFSKEEEKHTLNIVNTNSFKNELPNLNQPNSVLTIFKKAISQFRDEFLSALIADMNRIGYNISNIDTGVLHSIRIDKPLYHKLVGLRIKEKDRNEAITDQNEMSDGLFRALSILIHYNYFILENEQLNILIDDIGEGLDYERSTKLIELLIEKSKKSNFQLIMSTNDKFVMNNTSIDYWQVLDRKGGLVTVYNKSNSPTEFDDFRFTGLSNFDFFTTDFFKTGLQ